MTIGMNTHQVCFRELIFSCRIRLSEPRTKEGEHPMTFVRVRCSATNDKLFSRRCGSIWTHRDSKSISTNLRTSTQCSVEVCNVSSGEHRRMSSILSSRMWNPHTDQKVRARLLHCWRGISMDDSRLSNGTFAGHTHQKALSHRASAFFYKSIHSHRAAADKVPQTQSTTKTHA